MTTITEEHMSLEEHGKRVEDAFNAGVEGVDLSRYDEGDPQEPLPFPWDDYPISEGAEDGGMDEFNQAYPELVSAGELDQLALF